MMPKNIATDAQIISMLNHNDMAAWDLLYKKYASSTYGLICKLTPEKNLCDEILCDIYITLFKNNFLKNVSGNLCTSLLKFTYNHTIRFLKMHGKEPISHTEITQKELDLLCTCGLPLKEIAEKTARNQHETKKVIRHQLMQYRKVEL